MTKKLTKKERNMVDRWYNSDCTNIYDFYVNPSYQKVRAFNWHVENALRLGATQPIITGGNDSFFSIAYAYTDENDREILIYATGRNTYEIDITEI